MGGGLFELRRDDVTGWWVAVVVDREFDRSRFARRATPVGPPDGRCQNCAAAPADDTVFTRVLKPQAFTVAGGELAARDAGRDGGRGADRDEREPVLGLLGDIGSWATICAPRGHHGPLGEERTGIVVEMLARARSAIESARATPGTEYLQVVQNWGAQAGAMTNHLCIDTYDLPQVPHRIGEELGGAARYVIREGTCPYCRMIRDAVADRERLVFEDAAGVCFAPWASRSPFELWVVPRHHDADFGRATDAQLTSAAETLQKVLGCWRCWTGRPTTWCSTRRPSTSAWTRPTTGTGKIHPRLREIAGLELGTGLPVNPVSPEEAVEELLAAAGRGDPDSAGVSGGRSWDQFRAGRR